jgi:predicted phosphodiesterase
MPQGTWTPDRDALFTEYSVEEVAHQVGVSVEAAGRRWRRIKGAQYHMDREEVTELRKLVNQQAWIERAIDTIREYAMMPSMPLPHPDRDVGTVTDREHCLLFSDLQYGEKVSMAQTGGLANYNSAIAEKRLGMLVDRIVKVRDADPVARLNIFGLGDYIEGTTIYPSQSFHVDKHVIAQTMDCGRAVSTFVRELSAYYPEVSFHSVLGNHGRIDKNMPVAANLDMMMMRYAEALSMNLKNVSMTVHDQTWYAIVERMGQRFFLVHGDDMRLNMPSFEAYARRWRDLVGAYNYLLTGHHHRAISAELTATTLFINGSFVGPSEFSLKEMAQGGSASQTLFVLTKQGIESTRKLSLETNLRKARVFKD